MASNQQTYTVSVDGNVSAGKTSFLKALSDSTGQSSNFEVRPEPLSQFEHVLQEWSSHKTSSNLCHLQTRISLALVHRDQKHDTQTLTQPKIVIRERDLFSVENIFTKANIQLGLLDLEAQQTLRLLSDTLQNNYPQPDLRIFLSTCPELAFQRLKFRGQVGDNQVSQRYFNLLHSAHEQWFNILFDQNPDKVVKINGQFSHRRMIQDFWNIVDTKFPNFKC